MALQVWLPLNGTLENKGLSNITVTNSGTTVDNNGKIGKCYSFNGSSNYITIPQGYIGNEWSYSLWAYTTSGSVAQTLGCCRKSVGSGFSLFLTNGKLRIDSGGNNIQHTTTYSYPVNTWFHLTVTYGNGKTSYYINGEFKGSYTDTISSTYWGNIFSIGASQANGSSYGNYLNGRVNDVRIYNHCLSPKEVKEISKALIVHYPLDGNGKGGDNLLYNTNTANTSLFGFSEQTSGSNKTIEYDGWVPCIKVTRNSTAHSGWSYMYHTNLNHSAIKTSTTYTVSFDAIASGSGSIGWGGFMAGNATNNLSESLKIIQNNFNSTSWSHIILRTTTKSSFDGLSVGGQVVYMTCNFMNSTGVWIKVKNFKVEEGTADTPWCPNSSDALYTTLGYNNTTEYDTSGFGNNGTITGTLITNSDSPRYIASTVFDGSSYIVSSDLNLLGTSLFTISCWAYRTGSQNYLAPFWLGTSGINARGISIHGPSIARIEGGNGTDHFDVYSTGISANTWAHIVLTYNGNNVVEYLNGTQIKTISFPNGFGNTLIRMYVGYFWGLTPFTGKISDIRLYTTALSLDDIKELYNTSAFICNDGTVNAYEFIEDNSYTLDIGKNGVFSSFEFIEESDTAEFYSDKIKSTRIIEI